MKTTILFTLLLLFPFSNHSKSRIETSVTDENKKIGIAFLETLSSGDLEQFVSLFDENASYEEVGTGRVYYGRQAIFEYIDATLQGIPDSKFNLAGIVADERTVSVEWLWKGTNSVGWPGMGIQPTNKYFELKGVSVMIIENGLIVKNRDYWDWNSLISKISIL
jgi:steroid delta-isomerase-like uncharacterized protein